MSPTVRRGLLAAVAIFTLLATSLTGATATTQPDRDLTVAGHPEPAEIITAGKSPTSSLAQTDPDLLSRSDSTPVNVVIKLDYDAAATYAGGIPGLDATSPAVTGRDLTGDSRAERAYDRYARSREAAVVSDIDREVPSAEIGESLRVVYGGVAATIPADAVEDVLAIRGVVAVQEDTLNQPLTDSSPEFIGAPAVYDTLGTTADAGAGVIYGNLDTGVWPEHPSFADLGNLSTPPAAPSGQPRVCDFGDNPLTTAVDPFVCTNKLIGGQPFLDTYLSNPDRAAAEPYHTARDSNGHGTHTTSTTAGNILDEATVLGVDRGPIHGVAPGAWVMEYKVCGIEGCFNSDSAAAVQQAILDGVDVINYSITGGEDPFSDPVELAFLDAYAAGVFVAASAGNEGPGAATVNHRSPWVTTVGASTQTRQFESTLTVSGTEGTAEFSGASITDGAGPAPIVLASAAPYNDPLCLTPAPTASLDGLIVACQRGTNARVEKGYNVLQGGAAGMVLYNPALADVVSDSHWLPTVHLADGTDLLAFLAANPGATAEFTPGAATDGQGDVMADFSSRGPGGLFVKPDVTAPGVQILAGQTPIPESILEGPPGQYFQAIAGTSMSAPHTAGAAILLAALEPGWSPGQIKSALMTTAIEDVVKEDLTTPADPFDFGSGRIDLNSAPIAGLTVSDTAERFADLGADPLTAVHLNLPSINAPVVPGEFTTTRTFENASSQLLRYDVSATAPDGSEIGVSPQQLSLAPGESATVEIRIVTTANSGTHFGRVELTPRRNGPGVPLHLPVVFTATQGDVTLTTTCDDDEILKGASTTCHVEASNEGSGPATVELETSVFNPLAITGVDGAEQVGSHQVRLGPVELAAPIAGVPSVDPGTTPSGGWLPMSNFSAPIPIGDEQVINFNTPSYVYGGDTYTAMGVTSNGYIVVGGGTPQDVVFDPPPGPDPARPNNVLAPFWTDLNGDNSPGIYVVTLTDGVRTWIVVEHALNPFGLSNDVQHFQTWIGINGVEDITFGYNPADLPTSPWTTLVGAENAAGEGDMEPVDPTTNLRVTTASPEPGGTASYDLTLLGRHQGVGRVLTEMTASTVPGITRVETAVSVVLP